MRDESVIGLASQEGVTSSVTSGDGIVPVLTLEVALSIEVSPTNTGVIGDSTEAIGDATGVGRDISECAEISSGSEAMMMGVTTTWSLGLSIAGSAGVGLHPTHDGVGLDDHALPMRSSKSHIWIHLGYNSNNLSYFYILCKF